MTRLDAIRHYVDEICQSMPHASERRAAQTHAHAVAQNWASLAAGRGQDPELATAIGLLHDVYAYKTGAMAEHAANGAEMVRVAFKYELKGLFTEDEQARIQSAIYHHADKGLGHNAYDRNKAADVAEALAAKRVEGVLHDSDFVQIIRYFPEKRAYDELKNAWCAAFVYHCLYEAGLCLPIRPIHAAKGRSGTRLACVLAWYEWGDANGFCRFEKDGYAPVPGDIVIYSGIIPEEDKPPHSTWCDHIGIVLACDADGLTVAEGNVGNKNIAGIVKRQRDDTIGCYLHVLQAEVSPCACAVSLPG